jgi:AcrR family transcriptional regulator
VQFLRAALYARRVNGSDQPSDGAGEALPKLPPGRHGLPREFVTRNQSERITAGIIAAVAASGYHEATVSQIAAAAGLSRRTFYGYFKSKEECFFATYETIASHLEEEMREAGEGERGWPRRVAAELGALLGAYAANPDLASFTLAAPPAAGGEIAEAYRGFLERLLALVTEGMPKGARTPSETARYAMAGGLAALIVGKVNAGEGEELGALTPDLVELVLTPYMGRERAIKEARRQEA